MTTKDISRYEKLKKFSIRLVSYIKRKTFLLLPLNLKLFFAKNLNKFASDDIDTVIDYSMNALGGIIRPAQIHDEFHNFLKVFKDNNSQNILEIGTASGGSLFCLCKLAKNDATIISMDLPGGEFGGGYPEWKTSLYKMFNKKDQKLILLRCDSHLDESVKKIKEILNGKQMDFIFIDGDHSYEGVKKDLEIYSPLVRKGGIIAFHDIAPNGSKESAGGVPAFWKEIKNKYQYKEFIENEKQTGYGIGCIII
jgi:predicted O-methyltransferase YrrM